MFTLEGVTQCHATNCWIIYHYNKNNNNNKNVTRCRDSISAKSIETGRDGSIKQFSIQPHPTYLPTSKICRVEFSRQLRHGSAKHKCIWCSCFHLTVIQLCICLRKWNCWSEISHHCSLYLHYFGHAHYFL